MIPPPVLFIVLAPLSRYFDRDLRITLLIA
jgi:hypothetical protein